MALSWQPFIPSLSKNARDILSLIDEKNNILKSNILVFIFFLFNLETHGQVKIKFTYIALVCTSSFSSIFLVNLSAACDWKIMLKWVIYPFIYYILLKIFDLNKVF